MDGTGSRKTAYLILDELTANPKLARRLPPDLARRFHALPLAEENGRITVVMADPDDAVARAAVLAALGSASYVVQGDPVAIDTLLAEVWGDESHRCLDLRVCAFPDPVADKVWEYSQSLGELLGAQVRRLNTAGEVNALTQDKWCAECDLVVFGERHHRVIRHLLSRSTTGSAAASRQSDVPFAVLVAQGPRWPLRSILLVICGQDPADAAVDWVSLLARQSRSAVTVLAVVPPVPAMYGQRARMDQGLPALLTTETVLGQHLRRVAHHLVDWEIEGTLRLRQGPPDWQIRCEIAKGDYDLIALTARPRQWWLRWLEGDLVGLLLRWTERPVLIAKPTTA